MLIEPVERVLLHFQIELVTAGIEVAPVFVGCAGTLERNRDFFACRKQ